MIALVLLAQLLAPPSADPPFMSSTISQLPPYQAPGAGSVAQPIATKLAQIASVSDYGCLSGATQPDQAPCLNTMITALLAQGGGGSVTVWIPANFDLNLMSNVPINGQSVTIRGMGFGSRILINCQCDVFTINSPLFRLEDIELHVQNTSTRLGNSIIVSNSQLGSVHYVRLDGNGSSPNNGIFFKSTGFGTAAGVWRFDWVFVTDGTTWQNLALITNSSLTTTNTSHLFNHFMGGAKMTDAAWALDGTIDGVLIDHTYFTPQGGDALGPMLWTRNTVGGVTPGFPRWIHCNDCSFEAPGRNVVQYDTGRDLQYKGYIATGTKGIVIGANARNVLIDGVHFANVDQSCVTLAAGQDGATIVNNHFDECGVLTTNTYDAVSVAANTNNFMIRGNTFNNNAANKPRYGVNVAPGTSTGYGIVENLMHGTFGTGMINNQGSGVSEVLWNLPVQPSFSEHNASSIALVVPQFNVSVSNDGSGYKHKRTTGCATAASVGATCTTVVSWTSAFADTSYTVTCLGDLITSGVPMNGGITAKAVGSVTFQTVAATAVAAQYTNIDCVATHD